MRSGSTGSLGPDGMGVTLLSACSLSTALRLGPPTAPSWCARARPSWATTPSLSGNPSPGACARGHSSPERATVRSLSSVPGFHVKHDFIACTHTHACTCFPVSGKALLQGCPAPKLPRRPTPCFETGCLTRVECGVRSPARVSLPPCLPSGGTAKSSTAASTLGKTPGPPSSS